MTLQNTGGTRATVEAARKAIDKMIERAAAEKRVALPASKISVGLNCGGSDSFSGITANPALGVACDLLAQAGATFVLAETRIQSIQRFSRGKQQLTTVKAGSAHGTVSIILSDVRHNGNQGLVKRRRCALEVSHDSFSAMDGTFSLRQLD